MHAGPLPRANRTKARTSAELTPGAAGPAVTTSSTVGMRMKTFRNTFAGCLSSAVVGIVVAAHAAAVQIVPATPDTIEAHLAAGKNAAGGRDNTPDFYGLVTAICVAPLNGAQRPDAPAPRENPNRKATYLEPIKA